MQLLVGSEVIEQVGARLPLPRFRALAAGKFQIVEQEFAELLRRAEIELVSGKPVDFLFEPHGTLRKGTGEARKDGAIDLDAGVLHRQDGRNQRPFERLVDRRQPLSGKTRLQRHPQPQRHVGVFGRVFGRLVERHGGKRLLGLFGARRMLHRLRERHARVAEVALGENIHSVPVAATVEHIGEQHRIVEGRDLDAVVLHHQRVVLDVLSDLQHGRVFEQRTDDLRALRRS